jgi:hypothetical protein
MGNRFGSLTDSQPASAEKVSPFFAIIVNALGTDDAAQWFEAARKAHQRVVTAEQNRADHFGFTHHLDVETEAHQELTLPVVAASEATKALYEVTRRDAADVDVFFECALRTCSRGSGRPCCPCSTRVSPETVRMLRRTPHRTCSRPLAPFTTRSSRTWAAAEAEPPTQRPEDRVQGGWQARWQGLPSRTSGTSPTPGEEERARHLVSQS